MADPQASCRPDSLLGGRVHLLQEPRGHRAGTDAVLLAACACAKGVRKAVDLGASTGAVGLMFACRAPQAHVLLVEIDQQAASLARRNIEANGLGGRAAVVVADVRAPRAAREALGLAAADADLVLCNPPWLTHGRARLSPDSGRSAAHALGEGELDLWVKAALDLLRPRGALALIHRADALPDILAALDRRFGAVAARPVHPRAEQPATRVLVTAVKASRAPFSILPPLVLHDTAGRFTPLAEAIHAGEAALA